MSPFSREKKKHSEAPPTPALDSGLAPSSQLLQFPTNSQSPQEKQQSQPVCTWSAYTPQLGQSPSPFSRAGLALSTSATVAGELFLIGGYAKGPWSLSNDLYVISTRDFTTTLLKTTGDVPSPRYRHCVVLTSTALFIWGGTSDEKSKTTCNGDSFYLLNLVSREWACIVVNGPGPGGRFNHSMVLVGSKLFIFGGRTGKRRLGDIWALDLNCLKSNPFWESYEPAPGNEKPHPRSSHVSVTTGDHIIIFGGYGTLRFNDTWSFNILTRKWTELQCTGSIPSPRSGHAAVLIDDVMYVFGGYTDGEISLDDLTALNLSTQRWIAFQDIGSRPSPRDSHAMGCDGTRVFVLGGTLSRGAHADETKLIHFLDTQHLDYAEPDFDAVNSSEKTTRLVGKSSASPLTQGRPHQSLPSSSDAHATHRASPFQKASPEELDQPTFQQISRERNPNLNDLASRPTGASDRPGRTPEEVNDSEGSTEHHAQFVVPDGKEIARLEDKRLVELERQLSETLVEKTERDRRIAQLIDELALKTALLAQIAEEKKRAGLGQRELQAKLDEQQAKLDELILSRDEVLRTLEQAQSALQKAASHAADERSQHATELAEVRADLEGKKSELAAVRLRLTDAEDGLAKNKVEEDTLRAQTAASNTDMDRVMHRFMERMQAMETEISALRGNEKGIEDMECRNEE